jgi:uncharacterized protein YbjQ (UPF0145 family)
MENAKMAECKECGARLGFLSRSEGLCLDCAAAAFKAGEGKRLEALQQTQEVTQHREATISAVLLTTETAPNLKITKRIEIVTAEVAEGMHIFKDLFASVRDIVGGRSEAVQNTMRDARRTVLYELKREAHLVGANAVVGVDFDYVELGAPATNMILLVASGTAVVIEDEGL